MDLSMIESLIPNIAGWLGLEPSTVLLIVIIIGTGANLLARVIPDDAEGLRGTIRNIAKVVGLYVSNRVTKGVSTREVVEAVVKDKLDNELEQFLENRGVRSPPPPAFPGLLERDKGGTNEELDLGGGGGDDSIGGVHDDPEESDRRS